jgi:hypothetical protein
MKKADKKLKRLEKLKQLTDKTHLDDTYQRQELNFEMAKLT